MKTLLAFLTVSLATAHAELRIGIIGSDTSHVPAFTQILNDPTHPKHIPGARVVALHDAFSADIASSASRHEGYTRDLQEKWGVRLEPSPDALAASVDAVLIESLDGRPHLEQARAVFARRKPVFVDKPVAGSLRDAIALYKLAADSKTPVFSSSSYRFYPSLREVKAANVGAVHSVLSFGPAHIEPTHPDLFWYAVHPVEALYTLLGTGCVSVSRSKTPDSDSVTGIWQDGRMGIFHGLRNGATPHRTLVFGSKSVAEQRPGGDDYAPLVAEIVRFFQTGTPPVSPEETLEMFTFMEAADESVRRGGGPVKLEEVFRKASAEAAELSAPKHARQP
jgi:predicted dehydrogenase